MQSLVFNLAQSFLVDANAVKGAKKVDLSSVDLYFKAKPAPINNRSGITDPGVTIYLTELTADGKPDIGKFIAGNVASVARLEYYEINTSSDASIATKARFNKLQTVDTDKEYAFVAIYDGNENFELWKSVKGDALLGSNKVSPGPSGKYDGVFFDTFYATISGDANPADDISTSWKAKTDVDLKFTVNIARYSINGVAVNASSFAQNVTVTSTPISSSNVGVTYSGSNVTYTVSGQSHEFIEIDRKYSSAWSFASAGEYVYQNTVPYPGGSANPLSISVVKGSDLITANTYLPNGSLFSWSNVYGAGNNDEYIVVVSENDPASNKRKTDIKRVVSVESNTVLRVSSTCDFTNSAAKFVKSPVAKIKNLGKYRLYDTFYYRLNSKRRKINKDLLILVDSNANSTHRFVNNTINSISISAAGGLYNNSDYVTLTGYENSAKVKGGYPAIANIVTNSSGNITAIYMSNVGCGFVNTANVTYTFSNSTGGSSTGSGASFTLTTGMVLRTEFDGSMSGSIFNKGVFANCTVVNFEYSSILPDSPISSLAGSIYKMNYYNPYYYVISNDTHSGLTYHVDNVVARNKTAVRNLVDNLLVNKNIAVFPSRSNEFAIVDDVTGNPQTTPVSGSGVVEVIVTSNNDFVAPKPVDTSLTLGGYVINNDYTNENTDYGLAAAKHITKKISFDRNRFAEDVVVYLTAYRPLNTDIKVYARIHNSKDTEAFDDKDWTLLELVSDNIYSSSADPYNYIELSYGFTSSPNTVSTLGGTVSVADKTSLTVTGSATVFNTDLKTSDLIKIYSPLFPNNYVVSVVESVDSDTQITISNPTGNDDVTGSGLKIDFLGRVGNTTVAANGYPLQAFNNRLNDNVVRYYNSSMVEFDAYDTLQLKVVLLSDLQQVQTAEANVFPTTIPRVDDIRAVGVTS